MNSLGLESSRYSRILGVALAGAARSGRIAEVSEHIEHAVERQVRAYNAHDLDEFVACYAETVVVEDPDGNVLMNGREEMREQYGRLFSACPNVQAESLSRMRVGSFIVDEEHVKWRPDGDLHAIAIYRLDEGGLIGRVRFLR